MPRRNLPVVREEHRKSWFTNDLAMYSTVMAIAVLSYVNSLNGDFVHDDIPAIVNNADVIGKNPIGQLLLDDFWGTPMADANSHKSYRPLTTLSFRLNYALAGLQPWWWHASNVMLHAVCTALVARACVSVALLRRPFAALAAVLFAVHPIHTEAVAGLVGRADVLACIFFLSSLLLYQRPPRKKYVWLSIVFGALSILAKETGVTVLIINLAIDVYRYWPVINKSLYSLKFERKCSRLLVRVMKVVMSLAVLVGLRLALLQGTWPSFSQQDNPAAFHPYFFDRVMTFSYLAAYNCWLLLCPWSLSHDWQMGSVPLVTAVGDPRNLLTCAAFGIISLLAYRCFADFEAHKHTPAVVGLLLLVMPFLPASNLLLTVGFVIAERVLYIPSVGSVILAAYGVQLMWSRCGTTMRTALTAGVVIAAVSGVLRTHCRNLDWKDRPTLLRADLETLPQNAKLHYNFGNFLRETEQRHNAIKHYKEALRLWPTYASAHNNIGILVSNVEDAKQHFLEAININKYHVNAYYNLGKLYKEDGRISQAVPLLEKAVYLQPHFIPALTELLSLTPESEKPNLLKNLIKLDPDNWEHYMLYGDWFKAKGFPKLAVKMYLKATGLIFKDRNKSKRLGADLITFRATALMYRSLGQKWKNLQLIARWHTWRRGSLSAAATHLCLQDWRLKMELREKIQNYSKAVNSVKSTKCFGHSELAGQKRNAEGSSTTDNILNKNKHLMRNDRMKGDANNTDKFIKGEINVTSIESATSENTETDNHDDIDKTTSDDVVTCDHSVVCDNFGTCNRRVKDDNKNNNAGSCCSDQTQGTKVYDQLLVSKPITIHDASEKVKEKHKRFNKKHKTALNTNVMPNNKDPLDKILTKKRLVHNIYRL